ncbi:MULTISPECIES: MmgE/PrpD family protein [Sphingobium]|jgi:2-methylcitrate dehydratase PrpD|uniref:MmgE/Prp family protein n=1 Tax=Sphingobium fuliginis (strain ATCC 27551) TaxID=336203 RepID=A0A7M2GNC4_SPHSA|nr:MULTISPECIES: MmgE/PrpD family protein [Sphingobium]QOT73399.1 MmgE/PrpD family protein [Sphingobium fuliginis]WDA34743.1 MmgE/PrpD family protein [Sphingobium sp. YC-XJ3]GFZ92492.1 MmgE/Prp family protein [Sphingobium fuliginis]
MTLSQTFGEFAAHFPSAGMPPEVREAARWHMIDSIGVSIAGANPKEESGAAFGRLVAQWAKGKGDVKAASLFGFDRQARAELAALVNGSLAQALEMDDKHGSSLARPGSTVVPAVLAAAEAEGLSLAAAIDAAVVGYEVMIRLGFVAGDRFLERGYHTSSLIGSFGVAAAIGRLRGATPAQIADAMGIAGTFASGIQESTRTGSTSKILHGGWGAHAGMLAIDLAMAGITGPDTVFEGKFGFFETHLTPITGQLDFARAAEGLGTRWYLPETAYKPYPCCQLLHAFIEASKQVLADFARDGVTVAEIESVHCQLAEPGLTLVTEPRDRKKAPKTPHEGRFSLFFGVAAALVDGDVGLETFLSERLDDDRILTLAQKIEASVDPESDYPAHCPARLTVQAAGRRYFKHVPYHPGSPEAALSRADVLAKFERNTRWHFGDGAVSVAEAMGETPEAESLSDMLRPIRAVETLRQAS